MEKRSNLHSHGDGSNGIHLTFDPRSDGVSLLGELAAHQLVVLLLSQFLLECAVPLWHQLTYFRPFGSNILMTRDKDIERLTQLV